jgi:hypothetical protein
MMHLLNRDNSFHCCQNWKINWKKTLCKIAFEEVFIRGIGAKMGAQMKKSKN